MTTLVIYNAKAGTAPNNDPPTAESLREAFAAVGVAADIRAVAGSELKKALEQAVTERPDILYVGGGDGTISTAAGVLAGTSVVLGVLPLGTLNHFARDLHIPIGWRDAIAALVSAPVKKVDVAEVNGCVFINNCSLGSYAEAVRRRDALRREKGHGKWFAMLLASWSVFRQLRRLRLHIDTPGQSLTLRTPFVLVSNNRYTGRVLDSSLRPRLDEGRLWLYTTRAHRHAALLRLMWQSLTRRIDAADELEIHDVEEATVTSLRGTLPVATDGELAHVKPPLRFKIRPGALRVLSPAEPTPA
jgi:diacylglycerol kinase family enzyme